LIGSNDMIGEISVDLSELVRISSLIKKPLTFSKKFYEDDYLAAGGSKSISKTGFDKKDDSQIWLDIRYKDPETGKESIRGKVKVQIDVFPADQADKNPVGKARQEPNHSPFLPQPQGRFELSLNPFKMFNQLIGPAIRRKIYMLLCCLACAFLCAMMAPNLIAALIAKAI